MAYMGGIALPASEPDAGLAGQLIGGNYRVSHLLGEGGMASVWAGANERTGKLVALKIIRPSFMALPGAEAFLHGEALVASRVNHPNVVTVFDVIEHEGMACIVMELLDGMPLGTYITSNGPLSLPDALGLLLPAMRGVAAAHVQGVIHRDLKPQNIFVCVGPDSRIVTTKVLDFGISTMRDWARGSAMAAMPGLVGTPAYMSPEHLECADNIDGRADVYGFGLLLYEALSGRMAFPTQSGPELLRRVIFESAVPLRELRSDLPLGIYAIVDTAMAKRPEQRFASLDQMISAMEEQLMPVSSASRAGTPAAGVPIGTLSYTVSGPSAIAVPAHLGKEPSEPHCETRIFGQPVPARRTPEPAAPSAEVVDGPSHQLVAAPQAPLPANPALGTGGVVPAAPFASGPTTEVLGTGVRAIVQKLRDFRVMVGVALVLALGLPMVVWVATRSSPAVKTYPPAPAVAPKPSPSAPPSAPTLPVVEPLSGESQVLPVESAPPSAGLGLGESSTPAGPAQGHDSTEPSNDPADDEAPATDKVRSAHAGPTKAKPAATRTHAAKRTRLRAGTLSVDDF